MSKKTKKMRGTVEKIIKAGHPTEPEKAQIAINEADDLYREIRVENVLTDEKGQKEGLEPGQEVDVTLEAERDSRQKKSD